MFCRFWCPDGRALTRGACLQAKNLYVSESEGMRNKELIIETESTTTSETSSTDSEVLSGEPLSAICFPSNEHSSEFAS